MPEPDYKQPDRASHSVADEQDELLSEAELSTVVEMLAVMETAAELDVLSHLTLAQKQQVWNATPIETKARVSQLKQSEIETTQPDRPAQPTAIAAFNQSDELNLSIGDWVVLKAKPGLSKAELIAIFEVMQIQDDWVQVKAEEVGVKRYPQAWVLVYLRSPSDF